MLLDRLTAFIAAIFRLVLDLRLSRGKAMRFPEAGRLPWRKPSPLTGLRPQVRPPGKPGSDRNRRVGVNAGAKTMHRAKEEKRDRALAG
jgi:hypothetical protein